jgi:hypothetical protein
MKSDIGSSLVEQDIQMSSDALTVKPHDAPIEIKQKAPEQTLNQVNLPDPVAKKSETEDALEKRKKKV